MLKKLFVSEIAEAYRIDSKSWPPIEKTPDSYVDNLILARRQTGRTTFMIKSFPEHEKFYVVFRKASRGFDIKRLVEQIRGPEVASNMVVVSLSGLDSLKGSRGSIYIDDEIFDVLTKELHQKLNQSGVGIFEILQSLQRL